MNASVPHEIDHFDDITHIYVQQRHFFAAHETRSLALRSRALCRLRDAIVAHESDILAALQHDLHKSAFEAYGSEIGLVLSELKEAIHSLHHWVEPRRKPSSWFVFPAKSQLYPQPYGVTLIVSPWNYPFQLLFSPLIGAIAAGNCVVLKPSEHAPATAAITRMIIEQACDPQHVALIEGGIETSQALLNLRWDYIFFTGSTGVGRLVYQAAARHLTPVTLELGGKSPCYVDSDIDVRLTAKRIVWGKFLNAGQTCIAPDYILVHRTSQQALVTALIQEIKATYSEMPEGSTDYGRIINNTHFVRLMNYLSQGTIIYGGQHNATTRYISPTLITDVEADAPLMQEEIFGPILPIMTVDSVQEAITWINQREKPLALYVFSNQPQILAQFTEHTSSGGLCINDTLMHMANRHLPFGGVGQSGIGAYHGLATFDLFSHLKPVLQRGTWIDPPIRYAPHRLSVEWLKKIFAWTH